MRRYPLYGNVIVDSSNSTALGGTLTISNSCNTSLLNNQASIAFAVADISYGALKKGLFSNNVDTADARITAIVDTVSPTVGTGLSISVSPNHSNPPVEALRIRSNGNIGIGTQTPQFTLDVNGNIRLGTGTTGNIRFGSSGVGTTQAGYIDLINNNMTIMNQQNGNLIFGTNNAEDMRILTNGNVGIGTQTPQFRLDVSGQTGTLLRLSNSVGGYQGGESNIEFWNNQANYPLGKIVTRDTGVGPSGTFKSYMAFQVNYGSTSSSILREGMRLDGYGQTDVRLGIGTQTPQFTLDVSGDTRLNGSMYSQSTPGVWMINGSNPVSATVGVIPLFRSCTNAFTLYPTTPALPIADASGGAAAGIVYSVNATSQDDFYFIMPGYGFVAYTGTNYTGTITINVYNNTNNVRCYTPTGGANTMDSYKLYYNGVEIPP